MTPTPDFLLSIYLRGGADGLTLLAPYEDPVYQAKRDITRVKPPGVGNPDHQVLPLTPASGNTPAFGVPKVLAPLKELFDQSRLCFVHATGSVDISRSHFDQQRYMETGTPGNTGVMVSTGWLGRHLAATPTPAPLRALAIQQKAPLVLSGGQRVTSTADPAGYAMPGSAITATDRRAALTDMYGMFGGPLASPFDDFLSTVDRLGSVDFTSYVPQPASIYPQAPLGDALRQAAQIAKECPDVEIVHTDFDDWDTHYNQGVFAPVRMSGLMDTLARALHAFWRDVENHARKVVVLVRTEFGRSLDENSSGGTDHGRGGVAMVLGDHVAGGQVVTNWPGLQPPALDAGDLAVSIDLRDVMGEILTERLCTPSLSQIFPDPNYSYTRRGVIV